MKSGTAIRTLLEDISRNLWLGLGNLARRVMRQKVDYVVLELAGSMPEYIPPVPWWRKYLPSVPGLPGAPEGTSLLGLRTVLERIAADRRPRGVVIRLDGFDPRGWATACSVRDAILRFRKSGKRVVAYAEDYSNVSYFVATAAESIVVPSGGSWSVYGLRLELTFLKDALNAWGVQAEVLNVTPYKTAGDTFSRSDMSPEHRETLDWILDGQYSEIVNAIAAGRKLKTARVQELIDTAPRRAADALADGLVDAVCYFDELAGLLDQKQDTAPRDERKQKKDTQGARLVTWATASRLLMRPIRWRSGKAIAIVSLEGAITPGTSQRLPLPIPLPFVGDALAGSESVSQAIRRAEKDDDIAAIVLYVDSRGGSASASDLIWRELARVRRKKPVVVSMADYAASGGYYVSAGANWIVAQPLTVTGSIGVIIMKFVLAGMFGRLHAKQVHLERGARAGLFSSATPFGETGRPVVQQLVNEFYRQFKQVVADGRRMEETRLEPIAGGRVWLGTQALNLGLVDQLGDLWSAVEKAKEIAQLGTGKWTPAVWVGSGKGGLLPPPFPAQSSHALTRLLSTLGKERVWLVAPYDLNIK